MEFFIYVALFWIILLSLKFAVDYVKSSRQKNNSPNFHYKPKGPYLLSTGEKAFFDVLSGSVPDDIYICPRSDFAPLLMIELDGGSHNSKNCKTRSDRDAFVDNTFAQAEIPILHVAASASYDAERLASVIGDLVKR